MGRSGSRGGLRGGSSRSVGYRGGSSGHGGHRSARSYSSKTRGFVSGKIAGQYRAKGYSKARAQRIGNRVVSKMGGTFRAGRGSRLSYRAGLIAGRYHGRFSPYRAQRIGNAVVYGAPRKNRFITSENPRGKSREGTRSEGSLFSKSKSSGTEVDNGPRTTQAKYSRGYGKRYGSGYSKGYF